MMAYFINSLGHADVVVLPAQPVQLNAILIMIPVGKKGEAISLFDLSRKKLKHLESLTGQKMEFASK